MHIAGRTNIDRALPNEWRHGKICQKISGKAVKKQLIKTHKKNNRKKCNCTKSQTISALNGGGGGHNFHSLDW